VTADGALQTPQIHGLSPSAGDFGGETLLAGLAGDVCQATGHSEAAARDGGIDEHPVAENVQKVGHAARRLPYARRGASLRDGSRRSTLAAKRARNHRWRGTSDDVKPQTFLSSESGNGRKKLPPIRRSRNQLLRIPTSVVPGSASLVSPRSAERTRERRTLPHGFAFSCWYSTQAEQDRGAPSCAYREPPPHRGPR
jgi:hypothetical protein